VTSPAALIDRLPAHLRGPVWMVVACLAFSAVWGLIRAASAEVHPFVIVLWRNLVGTLLFLPFVFAHRTEFTQTTRLKIHLRRATSGLIATYATFYAVANAPLATVQAINFAVPLFTTAAAALFLSERIRARRIAALVIGFVGVLIVLRPGIEPLTPGILAAVLAAVSTVFSLIAIKQLVGTDDPRVVSAYTFMLMLPVSAVVALFWWQTPTLPTLGLLVGIGCCAVIGQIGTSKAFAAADASAVLPYDFLRFGVIIAIGWYAFGEAVDAATLVGGAVILGSAIYLAWREAQLARSAKPAGQPPLT
jgi:drug/metabolite transporter (DMT)-like permease